MSFSKLSNRDELGYPLKFKSASEAGLVGFTNGPGLALLLHCDGENNSKNFVDSSPFEHTVTAQSTCVISTAQSVFGGASLYTGSSTGYVSISDSVEFDPGAGDFTFHCWIYSTNSTKRQGIFFPATDTGLGVELWGDKICVWASSGSGWGIVTSDSTEGRSNRSIVEYTWTHIAVTRYNGVFNIFINGVLDKSINKTGTIVAVRQPRHVGYAINRGVFRGYLDEVTWIKGYARWTESFSPPTTPARSN